jgi:prepilin-type N-terminal cleavage/methylation domain-containing protein
MTKKDREITGQAGMTLVEILVTMAISGLIASVVFSLFQTHHRIAVRQSQTSLMQQELFSAVSLISEELRMCGFSAQGAPGFGFSHRPATGTPDYGRATTRSAVYCTHDMNSDGIVNESGEGSLREHAGFRLNVANDGSVKAVPDNVLRKYDTGAVRWQPVNTNIGDLRFTYFNACGNVITDPHTNTQSIRGVRVEITAIPSSSSPGLGIGNRTVSTTVWCRNTEMEKTP